MSRGRERNSDEDSKSGPGRGPDGDGGNRESARNGVWEKWLIFAWL